MVAEPDADVVAALRAGDETAFARLVQAWSPALLRTALALTGDRSTADSVVRATWLRLPAALDEYRPPPGLRAWVCGLLLGQLPLQEMGTSHGAGDGGPTVDRSRFLPPTHPQWPGHWEIPPTAWPAMDDARPVSHGVGAVLRDALEQLPVDERVVVGLRDVAACDVDEIARIVQQPPAGVRDLLHHGRAEVRRRLELHFAEVQLAQRS
jgi:RNA polymerase sigma-70 factor (ECF subfamily)